MTIYQIRDMMSALVNEETGEVEDFEKFLELAMAEDEKKENMACMVINLLADADKLKAQAKILTERARIATNTAERVKGYLAQYLNGEKFESDRVKVSFKKNPPKVKIEDEGKLIEWALENGLEDFVSIAEPTVSKSAVSAYIKAGNEVPYCEMVQETSMTIK